VGDWQYRANGQEVDPDTYVPEDGDDVLAAAKPAGA